MSSEPDVVSFPGPGGSTSVRTGAPTVGLRNGLLPPGRPQDDPGLMVAPGENGLRMCERGWWGMPDGLPGVPRGWLGLYAGGVNGGRKLKGGMEGVIGGRPWGVVWCDCCSEMR